MKHPGKTPPFRGPRGEPVPGSIAEAHNLHIGGMDQWALIRGARAANRPLVLLHGGPGMSETSFFRRCNALLEKSFTVPWPSRSPGTTRDQPPVFRRPLTAPSKTLVWFKESGHEPFVDEPAKFNAAMVEMVRPTAVVPQ